MREGEIRRHDLVRAEPEAFTAALRAQGLDAGIPLAADWAVQGRPLIVRRYHPGEDQHLVPLGLPLPPAAGKRRIGLTLPAEALAPLPAPTLAAVRDHAPDPWQPVLDALLALGAGHGLVPRPFGSLLWQALTGLPYLSETSDLDLLWPVEDLPPGFLADLARIAAAAPMGIDGEILLPDGAGIHWRERFEAHDTVLAKHLDRIEMRSVTPPRDVA